jgi:preprotein translocase subunit YajC
MNLMTTAFLFFQSAGPGSFLIQIFPFVLIFGVFYLLIIVPQRKRQKELQTTIQNLKTGDKVITTGGVVGTITALRETRVFLRSADKSILEVARSAVAGLDTEEESK